MNLNYDFTPSMSKQRLCLDLKLQLVEYLSNNNVLAWFKLLLLNKDFYPAYLYNLRRSRYILTANEINKLQQYLIKFPDDNALELESAAKYGYLNVVKYLIKNDTDSILVGASKENAFIEAAENGHLHVIKYLLNQFPNENLIYAKNHLALRFAASNGYLKVIKYLVQYVININTIILNNTIKLNNIIFIDAALLNAAVNGHLNLVPEFFEFQLATRRVA